MKIVNESLNDFKISQETVLNEFKAGDIGKFFKKVGKLFVGLFKNEPVNAQLPINIALAQTDNSDFSMVPSAEDVKMAPELSSVTPESVIKKIDKQKSEDLGPTSPPPGNVSEDFKHKLIKARLNEADGPDRDYISLDHPDEEVGNVNAAELADEIKDLISYSENPVINKKGRMISERAMVIWGAPGIGKTEIVKQAIKAAGSKKRSLVIQLQNMRSDEWFIPYIDKTEATEDDKASPTPGAAKGAKLEYHNVIKSWLPCYKPTGDPEYDQQQDNFCNGGNETDEGSGGLLFFDEISRADGAVQGSVMNLIQDRALDEYVLGSKWVVVTAANREFDDLDTDIKWSTALGDRLNQFNYIPDVESWSEWAISEMIDPAVINFLNFSENKMFYGLATGQTKHGPSPRSWVAVSDVLTMSEDRRKKGENVDSKAKLRRKIVGAVGNSAADQFIAFFILLQEYSMEAIKSIFTSPDKAPMPYATGKKNIDIAKANALTTTAITYMQDKKLTPEAWENFCRYLVRLDNDSGGRNAESVATSAYKMMIAIHPDISTKSGYAGKAGGDFKKGVDIFSDYYH
jgi:hypothetical protein